MSSNYRELIKFKHKLYFCLPSGIFQTAKTDNKTPSVYSLTEANIEVQLFRLLRINIVVSHM